jgi:NIPSNAP
MRALPKPSIVKMFNAGGEIDLFKRLNFNAIFYAEVITGAHMPNLIYMTSFENMAERTKHWKAFVDSPEWKVLIADEQYKNNVSRNQTILMRNTDYSDY